jgi:hypothetical protein
LQSEASPEVSYADDAFVSFRRSVAYFPLP